VHEHNGLSSPAAPVRLHRDPFGRLVFTDGAGRSHDGVDVVRGFPITAPRHGIAICDAQGRELLWIEDLDAVDPSLRQTIEDELARREFIPVLRRIFSVSSNVEPSQWEIDTDRGRTKFVLNNEEDIRPLRGNAALIVDANGVRYLIPDHRALDATSRRLLERFIY
jgi:hypothetical protein